MSTHTHEENGFNRLTKVCFADDVDLIYTDRIKIWVTFSMNGIHCYPSAPEEVKYLRDPHRHLFKFKVGIQTYHMDREVEFHMLQNEVRSWYSDGVLQLDHKSCEMLARELLDNLRRKYPGRGYYAVEVSEDGECGAEVSYEA